MPSPSLSPLTPWRSPATEFLSHRVHAGNILVALLLLAFTDDVIYGGLSLTEMAIERLAPERLALVLINLVVPVLALGAWGGNRLTALRWLLLFQNGWMTLAQLYYVVTMLVSLASFTVGAVVLRDAVLIWISNVVIFAIWYWAIDGGGPHQRTLGAPAGAGRVDLVFPLELNPVAGWAGWQPHFGDYLFTAFQTSFTFSPGDTLLASTRGKLLSMLQAALALIVLVLIAARAINLLT